MGVLVPFMKAGGKIARNEPDNEEQAANEEAKLQFEEIQTERSQKQNLLVLKKNKATEEKQKLETAKKEAMTTESKAKLGHFAGKMSLFIAALMALTCIGLVYWAIAPAFYGREWVAWLIAAGCGISTAICGHLLLEYLARILNKFQFRAFLILCSLTMLALCIGGSIFLGKARSLQWELQNHLEGDSALELEAKEDSAINIDELKKEIEKLTSRALILMAITLDVVAAMLLFIGTSKISKTREVVMHSINVKRLEKRIDKLETRIAYLESLTKEAVESGISAGIRKGKTKGSMSVLIIVTLVFVLSIVLFLLISEGVVFAKEPNTHILACLDVTGSTERDRRENIKAILKIMDSLKPGDSIDVMLISEKTFNDPEYLLNAKMPSKTGYFKEHALRAKRSLIREFRAKAEKLSESRCATSIIDGVYLFTELVKESQAERKVLVLLSDMIQTAQNINSDTLSKKGKSIISELKADGLIPDMKGIDVYVMGASTYGMNLTQWTSLKRFWVKYFSAAEANLKSYSIGRGSIQ
jgi:hypothetical protein